MHFLTTHLVRLIDGGCNYIYHVDQAVDKTCIVLEKEEDVVIIIVVV